MDKRTRSNLLIPAIAASAAALLLIPAAKQQHVYYEEQVRQFPNLLDPDYAYSPPARLLALITLGPSVLVPYGFSSAAVERPIFLPISVGAVFLFWSGILWLRNTWRDASRGNSGSVLSVLSIATAFSAGATALSARHLAQLASVLDWSFFLSVIKHYGFACVLWIDCAAVLWLFALTLLLSFKTAHVVRSRRVQRL